jgi:hypothetical protein
MLTTAFTEANTSAVRAIYNKIKKNEDFKIFFYFYL